MIDRGHVKRIAGALATDEGFVEKDWHVVRAIGVLAALDHAGAIPVFSGGPSLSNGWGLIKRFSEDIGFMVAMPSAVTKSEGRRGRRACRERVLWALISDSFDFAGESLVGNESRFFAADLAYPGEFAATLIHSGVFPCGGRSMHMTSRYGESGAPLAGNGPTHFR